MARDVELVVEDEFGEVGGHERAKRVDADEEDIGEVEDLDAQNSRVEYGELVVGKGSKTGWKHRRAGCRAMQSSEGHETPMPIEESFAEGRALHHGKDIQRRDVSSETVIDNVLSDDDIEETKAAEETAVDGGTNEA